MWKVIYSAVIAASLIAMPISAQTQEQSKAKPEINKSAGKSKATKSKATSKREPTPGQLAARERQKQCGVEWREAKAAGKAKGTTWPKFWSACNTRLKGKST